MPLPTLQHPRAGVSEGTRIRLVGGTYGGCTGTFLYSIPPSGVLSYVTIDDDTRARRRLSTRFIYADTASLSEQARLALLCRIFQESRTIEERLRHLSSDVLDVSLNLSVLLDEWPE